MTIGHITLGTVFHLAGQSNFSLFGPMDGLILHHPKMTIIKKKDKIRPGIIPAIKSLPMDC
jgi:hypothetical protein